jgi:hypothetical protein
MIEGTEDAKREGQTEEPLLRVRVLDARSDDVFGGCLSIGVCRSQTVSAITLYVLCTRTYYRWLDGIGRHKFSILYHDHHGHGPWAMDIHRYPGDGEATTQKKSSTA